MTELRPIKTAAETALAEAFVSAKARLPGGREVAARREAAFRRFEAAGRLRLSYQGHPVADLDMAQMAMFVAHSSEDAREGPRAFAEKREPQFKGF